LASSCLSICLSVFLLSVLPSLHPFIVFMEHTGSHWMNSHEIWYLSIFQKSVKKIQVSLKAYNYNWYFIPEDQYTFCIISYSVPLRMRNVSDTNYRVYHNTHFMFNHFFSKIHAIYEIMWEIWYSQTGHRWQYSACPVCAKATDTHSYIIYIAFPSNSGFLNMPQCYGICILTVSLFHCHWLEFHLQHYIPLALKKTW
jgi:hypothetical protein